MAPVDLETIGILSLPTWHQTPPRNKLDAIIQSKVHETSPFPFCEDINKKLAFWQGDISSLSCDAIVHTTNESFKDHSPLTEKIFQRAGPQLKEDLVYNVKVCRTGDAKITKGYNLPAKFVIHTVGPKYNAKYQTAAETALFSCYQRVFQIFREKKLRTLGLSAINSVRRGYPPHEGAHLALRAIRRFLEQHFESITMIALVVEEIDMGIYDLLLPLYFPRSAEEEEYALYYLPKDVGGPAGEPFIQERKIRIVDKPFSDGPDAEEEDDDDDANNEAVKLDGSVVVGHTDFAMMKGDQDKTHNSHASNPLTKELQRHTRYQRLLRKARTEDFGNLPSLKIIYQSGEDRLGRPVFIIVGQRLNSELVNFDKVLLYMIQLMDPVVHKDYVMIYFHTQTNHQNYPSFNYLREAYNILDYKYKKNLKAFYIVHPTFWSRVLTWWFTTFTAASIKNKVQSLGGVEYLYYSIPASQLDIPSFVLEHDQKVNGRRYCNPPSDGL